MKYLPGIAIAEARGSLGGTTFSRNSSGAYTRNRVSGVNANTAAQQLVRGRLSDYAQSWRGLGTVNQDGWDSLGAQMTRTDSLGQSYTLTGFQAFVSVNCQLKAAGMAEVSSAPILDTAPELLTLTLTANEVPEMDLAYTATGGAADNKLIITATPPISAGIQRPKASLFKQIKAVAGNVATPIDIQSDYENVFGAPLTGSRVFVRVYGVSKNGFAGPHLQTFADTTLA